MKNNSSNKWVVKESFTIARYDRRKKTLTETHTHTHTHTHIHTHNHTHTHEKAVKK